MPAHLARKINSGKFRILVDHAPWRWREFLRDPDEDELHGCGILWRGTTPHASAKECDP